MPYESIASALRHYSLVVRSTVHSCLKEIATVAALPRNGINRSLRFLVSAAHHESRGVTAFASTLITSLAS